MTPPAEYHCSSRQGMHHQNSRRGMGGPPDRRSPDAMIQKTRVLMRARKSGSKGGWEAGSSSCDRPGAGPAEDTPMQEEHLKAWVRKAAYSLFRLTLVFAVRNNY